MLDPNLRTGQIIVNLNTRGTTLKVNGVFLIYINPCTGIINLNLNTDVLVLRLKYPFELEKFEHIKDTWQAYTGKLSLAGWIQ